MSIPVVAKMGSKMGEVRRQAIVWCLEGFISVSPTFHLSSIIIDSCSVLLQFRWALRGWRETFPSQLLWAVLVVGIVLRNRLHCHESPTTTFQLSSPFLPPPSAQLQMLPPCLAQQFISIASYFLFFSLPPNFQFCNIFMELVILSCHHGTIKCQGP